jgi:hypothetical protein
MSSTLAYCSNRPAKPPAIFKWIAATTIPSAGCLGGNKHEGGADRVASTPTVSIVAASLVQKTIPLLTELTARTGATDSVDIRARVTAFLLTRDYADDTAEANLGVVQAQLSKTAPQPALVGGHD